MYKLNILYFVNKTVLFTLLNEILCARKNYKPTNYNLQSFMKKVTDCPLLVGKSVSSETYLASLGTGMA